jgi:hypothetical protein
LNPAANRAATPTRVPAVLLFAMLAGCAAPPRPPAPASALLTVAETSVSCNAEKYKFVEFTAEAWGSTGSVSATLPKDDRCSTYTVSAGTGAVVALVPVASDIGLLRCRHEYAGLVELIQENSPNASFQKVAKNIKRRCQPILAADTDVEFKRNVSPDFFK